MRRKKMSSINKILYPEYNIEIINNVMSLRKPQKTSLKILDNILDEIDLEKNPNLEETQEIIHDLYPLFI